jgi:hypothetical protein
MLKTADASSPAETYAASLNKGAIAKNRITVQHAKAQEVTENYQFVFHSLSATPTKTTTPKPAPQQPAIQNPYSMRRNPYISETRF